MNKKYKLNKELLDLLIEHKNNDNVTFKLSNNDIRILLTYIEVLQQENARLKETFEKITNYIKEHDYDYIYLDCKFLETQIYNDLLQMLNKIKEN